MNLRPGLVVTMALMVVAVVGSGALAQGSLAWVDRTTTGPDERGYTAMAYDSARGVTVLFSGGGYPPHSNDTWEWNGTNWALRSSGGPSFRYAHAMAYDSARNVTVLFGGGSEDAILCGDTWEWDGTSWTFRSSSGPSARFWHAMAYDSARGVTVLFGGYEDDHFEHRSGETWEWDGTSWTLRSTGGPSPRGSLAMAYDSARGVTVLFGGAGDSGLCGDTWEWNGTSWTLGSSSGPSPRANHAMAYDSARGVTVLFGGSPSSGETWVWDGTSWTLRSSDWPSPRHAHAMSYDSVRGVTVLFGGYDGSYNSETWEWTLCATLTLTFTNGDRGRVELEPNDSSWPPFTYPPGTEVTLTAEPNEGGVFKFWRIHDPNHPGDANYIVTDSNDTITILMDTDREVTAVFGCGHTGGVLLPLMVGALGMFAMIRRRW